MLLEFSAAFTISRDTVTFVIPPACLISSFIALSPFTVSSFIATFCLVNILLLTLSDLSTSAFEWHNTSAHLTIFGKMMKLSPLSSVLLNILFQKWSTRTSKSSFVKSISWYLTHSFPTLTASAAVTLGNSLAIVTQYSHPFADFCYRGLRHLKASNSTSSIGNIFWKYFIMAL